MQINNLHCRTQSDEELFAQVKATRARVAYRIFCRHIPVRLQEALNVVRLSFLLNHLEKSENIQLRRLLSVVRMSQREKKLLFSKYGVLGKFWLQKSDFLERSVGEMNIFNDKKY